MVLSLTHLLLAARSAALGVQPLVMELSADPGRSVPFAVTLTASGRAEPVTLRLYRVVQLPSGELSYRPPDPATPDATSWVRLESERVQVPADRALVVNGRVDVPVGARGSHTVVLMVEPEAQPGVGGIGVQVRYAVRLHLRLGGLTALPRLELADASWEREANRALVRVRVQNTSPVDFLVSGEATLRDASLRVIERIPLLTEVARRAQLTETRIYPGSTLELTGPVTAALPAGRYQLRVTVRYAEGSTLTVDRELVLDEPLAAGPAVGGLVVEPAELHVRLAPGALANRSLDVTNRGTQPVEVWAFARDVEEGYARSVWPFVRLRSAVPLRLDPGQSARLVLTVQIDRAQATGGYYGYLILRAWPAGVAPNSGPPLYEATSLLATTVGQAPGPAVALGRLAYLPPDDQRQQPSLALPLRHTGGVHFAPSGQVRLTGPNGQLAGEWLLQLTDGRRWLFPGQAAPLVATVPALKPGTYQAVVRVQAGGQILAEERQTLEVSGPTVDPAPEEVTP